MPSRLDPYLSVDDNAERPQADRIAHGMLENAAGRRQDRFGVVWMVDISSPSSDPGEPDSPTLVG